MYRSVWYPPLKSRGMAAQLYNEVFGVVDEADEMGWHVALTVGDSPAAAGRLSYVKAGLGEIDRVCVSPDYGCQGLDDATIRLLIFKAAQLGITTVQASADKISLKLLKSIGFQPGDNNMYVKEVCDGCCEDCKNKCSGEEK